MTKRAAPKKRRFSKLTDAEVMKYVMNNVDGSVTISRILYDCRGDKPPSVQVALYNDLERAIELAKRLRKIIKKNRLCTTTNAKT